MILDRDYITESGIPFNLPLGILTPRSREPLFVLLARPLGHEQTDDYCGQEKEADSRSRAEQEQQSSDQQNRHDEKQRWPEKRSEQKEQQNSTERWAEHTQNEQKQKIAAIVVIHEPSIAQCQ